MPLIGKPQPLNLPAPLQILSNMVFGGPEDLPTPPIAGMMTRMPKEAGLKVLERVRTLPTLSGFSQDAVSALTMLQSKYPRLFSHITNVETAPTKAAMGNAVGTTEQAAKGLSKMQLLEGLSGDEARKTIGHEAAHVAQRVRNPTEFMKQYRNAEQALGYKGNPFEQRAEQAGENFAKRIAKGK